VPDDLEVLRVREGHEVVSLIEIPGLLRPAERIRLHAVLGRHMTELRRQQRPVRRAIRNPVSQADARVPRRRLSQSLGNARNDRQEESEKQERLTGHAMNQVQMTHDVNPA